jgi:hypothetical protein
MTEGYTWQDHIALAYGHVRDAYDEIDENPVEIRSQLQAARASITRALILLPKVRDEDDAA